MPLFTTLIETARGNGGQVVEYSDGSLTLTVFHDGLPTFTKPLPRHTSESRIHLLIDGVVLDLDGGQVEHIIKAGWVPERWLGSAA